MPAYGPVVAAIYPSTPVKSTFFQTHFFLFFPLSVGENKDTRLRLPAFCQGVAAIILKQWPSRLCFRHIGRSSHETDLSLSLFPGFAALEKILHLYEARTTSSIGIVSREAFFFFSPLLLSFVCELASLQLPAGRDMRHETAVAARFFCLFPANDLRQRRHHELELGHFLLLLVSVRIEEVRGRQTGRACGLRIARLLARDNGFEVRPKVVRIPLSLEHGVIVAPAGFLLFLLRFFFVSPS